MQARACHGGRRFETDSAHAAISSADTAGGRIAELQRHRFLPLAAVFLGDGTLPQNQQHAVNMLMHLHGMGWSAGDNLIQALGVRRLNANVKSVIHCRACARGTTQVSTSVHSLLAPYSQDASFCLHSTQLHHARSAMHVATVAHPSVSYTLARLAVGERHSSRVAGAGSLSNVT